MTSASALLERFGFFPYQRRWLADGARLKIGLWARQTGKDFCSAAEAVVDCLTHPGATWLLLATGERQALESMAKAKEWSRALGLVLGRAAVERGQAPPVDPVLTASEIRWPNGSRFIALPAKPETVRGYSANVILTEFAFHEDAEAIWRAIYPSISNPLRGGTKKLRIISTPNGLANKFAELWHEADGYSRHKIDVYTAQADGLPIDVPGLKHGLHDPEAWGQEYECAFIDGSSVLLPLELIQRCESSDSTEACTPGELSMLEGPLYAGIDFGRKHDRTVFWLLHALPAPKAPAGLKSRHTLMTKEVLVLDKVPTPAQFSLLRSRVALCNRVALDYTGPGVGLGDLMLAEFGAKVELCNFTAGFKEELFPRMRSAMEQGYLFIPGSTAIREDLHSIQRHTTPAGQILYRARRTPDGHSDRATALALALHAANAQPQPMGAVTFGRPHAVFDRALSIAKGGLF